MEGESKENPEIVGSKASKSTKAKKSEVSTTAVSNSPVVSKSMTDKFRENPWIVASLVLGIVAFVLLLNNFSGGSITGSAITGGAVATQSDVESKVLGFINSQVDTPVSIVETNMVSGLYEVVVLYQGQQVPIYVTADGKNLVQGLTPLDLLAQQTGATGSVGSTEPSSAQVTEVSLDDDPVLGNPNAPITIIEFSDYQCPFCQRFWTETLPLIKSQYIDTGKVKLVYRDFPLSSIHPDAQKAAEAAECADEQGKYWEYHDKLFENQFDLSITALKRYAQELGLNTEKFNTCLDSGQMASEVSKDLSEGTAAGVQGTPGFFINGRFLGGAYPFEQFKTIIDEELAKIA